MVQVNELLIEKCADNFRYEPEPRYKAGYDTTARWSALLYLRDSVQHVVDLFAEYAESNDEQERYVADDYEALLNELRRWHEVIVDNMADVDMDTQLEQAAQW